MDWFLQEGAERMEQDVGGVAEFFWDEEHRVHQDCTSAGGLIVRAVRDEPE
jgi:hypothetical protein